MLHKKRQFLVKIFKHNERAEFIDALVNNTWTSDTGFFFMGFYFLNDSTSPNGAQEFAVVVLRHDNFYQIESWTVSWLKEPSVVIRMLDVLLDCKEVWPSVTHIKNPIKVLPREHTHLL